MSVRPLPPDVLRVGDSTLFALRDKTGMLLVPKGTLIESDAQLRTLLERDLYVDEQDSELLRRALGSKLDGMVRENQTLGRMASVRAEANDLVGSSDSGTPRRLNDATGAWSDLQVRLGAVLRDPAQPDFLARLQAIERTLVDQINSDPDDALLLLVHEATQQFRDYSASHALLVAVVCELAARHLSAAIPLAMRPSLRGAALTMNVAMTALQNQLALQDAPLSPEQRAQVDQHAALGRQALRAAGLADEAWLEAVAHHHDAPPGPLAGLPPALRLARLIRRADVFAARMSPRRKRTALSANAAAKAAYLDERGQPDEAGSAIIKAVGLYPPGCLVRLKSGETAVVLRRGRRANEPVVAAIVNPMGIAMAEPSLRQTRQPAYEVAAGVAPHEVRVRLNLERMLRMT